MEAAPVESREASSDAGLSAGLLETYMKRFELTRDQVLEQKMCFDEVDEDKSGTISKEEMEACLEKEGENFAAELEEQWKELDVNGDGKVEFQEFLKFYVKYALDRDVAIKSVEEDGVVTDLDYQKTRSQKSLGSRRTISAVQEVEGEEMDDEEAAGEGNVKDGKLLEEHSQARGADGAFEMKMSQKSTAGFYIRAASAFLRGVEAKDGAPAKPPVDRLKLAALGNTVNLAVAVAARVEADGLGKIVKVTTGYPEMQSAQGPRFCPQVIIEIARTAATA